MQAQLTAAQIKLNRLHLETRAATLAKQISVLTGLPAASIVPDHASIPEIPAVSGDDAPRRTAALNSAEMMALSKERVAKGDRRAYLDAAVQFRRALQPQHHAAEQR